MLNSQQQNSEYKYEILPDDYGESDLNFKIIVIGDSGVGKSCLTTKATKNIFEESYNATVGFEFFNYNIKIEDKIIRLQIWDTCGQELYHSLITNFYRNSSLAVVVYAVNQRETFEDVDMWLRELRKNSNPDVKVFIIGNKVDLVDERTVTKEEGEAFVKKNKLGKYFEASAKTGINTQEIFIDAAMILYQNYLKYNTYLNEIPDIEDKKNNNNKSFDKGNIEISIDDDKKRVCCF